MLFTSLSTIFTLTLASPLKGEGSKAVLSSLTIARICRPAHTNRTRYKGFSSMKEILLRFDPFFVTPFFQEIGGQFKPKHALQPSHLSGSTFSAGLGLIFALLNKTQGLLGNDN